MRIGSFTSAWDEQRTPIADEALDAERRARYWAWSASGAFSDAAPTMLSSDDGSRWAFIDSPENADYEAFHMRHSVGYNFDHYSAMGTIVSYRDPSNIPVFTALVANGVVVHSRRRENAPLTPEDLALLDAVCERVGWTRLDPELL